MPIYNVTGYIRKYIEETIEADSKEKAIEEIMEEYGDHEDDDLQVDEF